MDKEYAASVAKINDEFRRGSFGVTITRGVQTLNDLPGLIDAVRRSNTFTEDNDPYGEHDFGSIVWQGNKVFWKLDYYDQSLKTDNATALVKIFCCFVASMPNCLSNTQCTIISRIVSLGRFPSVSTVE